MGTLFPDDDEYPGQRPLPARLAPGPVRSLILAFVIVTVATIALVFFEDRTAQRQWPALAAPVIPAIYILGLFFTGGFHGMASVPRYLLVLGIWYVALVIWWILIEVCRITWGFLRGTGL